MGILIWMIVGMMAGWFAGRVMGSRGSGSAAVGDLLLGAMGALVGGFLAAALMGITGSIEGFNFVTTLVSCVGAVAMVVFVKAMNSRRAAAVDE
jgi:uncharacterized membrane protein YeaQ/YmgE (transglycosylase-associated protein family)